MSSSRSLAVAFDVGTTTIAASLVDPASAARLAVTGALNPQRPWGADVLARLTAAADPEALSAMKGALALEMEHMAEELLGKAGAEPDHLVSVAVAANPAMEHIALGLPVASLAYPPFRPLFSQGRNATTLDLGWRRAIPAYLFPLPGGFVGGDLVAFLFGLGDEATPGSLYLDMGTNAEMALFDGERFLATSAAAGPAFEGGNLSCGMSALPGAVSSVTIEGERLRIRTIGGAPACGICGSGVLDAVAALLAAGVIDRTGRLLPAAEIPSNLGNRVQEVDGTRAFVLHRDARRLVYVSQDDIRALQLAKGALRGGMEILLQKGGLSLDDLAEVVLTGSFGAVLSPEMLKNVGIFSENMVKISGFVREGALAGVERLLMEADGAAKVETLAARIRVIPLSGTPLFEQRFLANIDFPEKQA
ncbi:MAG TPA: ASKHA domain-containing protein [Geomonas sp.]|nr:ASKHA domain-containing protein [Geomonas sp.]